MHFLNLPSHVTAPRDLEARRRAARGALFGMSLSDKVAALRRSLSRVMFISEGPLVALVEAWPMALRAPGGEAGGPQSQR